jgi:ABC-type uncharacterized transport system substrate-binding protein
MQRREFIAFLGVATAWPLVASAQTKISRIGFMGNSTAALEANLVDAFREGLHELGYEEGRNIVIEYRWADGKYDQFPTLVAELIAAKVDVIVTAGTPAALAVKKATTTVPLVMVAVGDPVGTGLVPSLARPGGNLTGLSSVAPDLEGKRLQLLRTPCRPACLVTARHGRWRSGRGFPGSSPGTTQGPIFSSWFKTATADALRITVLRPLLRQK